MYQFRRHTVLKIIDAQKQSRCHGIPGRLPHVRLGCYFTDLWKAFYFPFCHKQLRGSIFATVYRDCYDIKEARKRNSGHQEAPSQYPLLHFNFGEAHKGWPSGASDSPSTMTVLSFIPSKSPLVITSPIVCRHLRRVLNINSPTPTPHLQCKYPFD